MRFVTHRRGGKRVSMAEIRFGAKPEGFPPSDFRPEISVPAKGEYPKEL